MTTDPLHPVRRRVQPGLLSLRGGMRPRSDSLSNRPVIMPFGVHSDRPSMQASRRRDPGRLLEILYRILAMHAAMMPINDSGIMTYPAVGQLAVSSKYPNRTGPMNIPRFWPRAATPMPIPIV